MALLASILWGVTSLVRFATAQHNEVCAWTQSRAGTVRDALFIDGGIVVNSNEEQWEPSGWLYKFNYSTPFDYQNSQLDLMRLLQNDSLTSTGSSYDAPLYRGGAMFVDDYELYTYGGLPVADESTNTIMNFHLFPNDGQTIFDYGADLYYKLSNINNYVTAGASVSVPSEMLAFYFSGMSDSSGAPLSQYDSNLTTSNSMIKVDMSSPGDAVWSEDSLPDNIPDRADAQMVWIPVSTQGILLVIGGVRNPAELFSYALTDEQTEESKENSPGFMTTIPVYDIATGNWYTQTTTGDTPGQLSSFCAVVAHQPEGDTYEVYIYGGDNGLAYGDKKNAQDTVWALSVPSFRWTKVKDGKPEHGRGGHVCSMPYPDQMLVFGGWNVQSDAGFCITDGSVIDVFDLNELTWTKRYDPSSGKNYTTPTAINKTPRTIGSEIQALFDQPYDQTKIRHWYPYKTESSPKKPTPLGAIVGGAVGGAATAIVIAVLVWCCWPSRRQRRREKQSEAATTSTLRNGRVYRWLPGIQRPSADLPHIPKDLASVSTTEVDGSMSPPPPTAEVYGDSYFRPNPHVSPIQHSAAAEINSAASHSPRRLSHHSAQAPRSPRSLAARSIEVDGEEVHEKDGNMYNSQLCDLGQGHFDFRQHPAYPYSIDRVANSDTNSNSYRNPLGSNISHVSGRSRQHSNTAPSPVPAPASVHEVDNGDINANEKGTDTVMPAALRPIYHRNQSSISSNLPITPPTVNENANNNGNAERSLLEIRMSATSGPIPPTLHQDEYGRPTHRRHGSSMSSNLSGNSNINNIALPPPLNATSPSSMYSPTTAGVSTGTGLYTDASVRTGAGTGTGSAAATGGSAGWRDLREEGDTTIMGISAENTLVGSGPSPYMEKVNSMAAMAASLGSPRTSEAGTRRKPVGSRSAYDENGGYRGGGV